MKFSPLASPKTEANQPLAVAIDPYLSLSPRWTKADKSHTLNQPGSTLTRLVMPHLEPDPRLQ